jgi:hypothetical protein
MQIRYGKTFNLGNYSSEHIEIELDHVERAKSDLVFAYLLEKVEALHQISVERARKGGDPAALNRLDPNWLESQHND